MYLLHQTLQKYTEGRSQVSDISHTTAPIHKPPQKHLYNLERGSDKENLSICAHFTMACHRAVGTSTLLLLVLLVVGAQASRLSESVFSHATLSGERKLLAAHVSTGDGGVPEGGYQAVAADIAALLADSQDFWPADFGNYGPFFIRLAWHCSGSFRQSDGRGGCDGGRIRFDPELNWEDNGNLDKALELLKPIKEKYGSSLSWGDLIVLAGNTAIKEMGGPTLGFCGGRYDDADGSNSLRLGPSPEQEAIAPCEVNGQCESPLGPTTIGLIYVNPEGPMGVPDPSGSVNDVRSSFGRMRMNDTETAALIGGGHAFGKVHGACAEPPCGEGPEQGKGPNTFTSGFEGTWTTIPTTWSNQYFNNLLSFTWNKVDSPAGHTQWAPKTSDGSDGPPVIMLTSDIALLNDDSYLKLVEEWAVDIKSLEAQFAAAWYKLTAGDMGPASRCLGDMVPPPQSWQNSVPEGAPVDSTVEQTVRESLDDLIAQDASNAAKFAHLAWNCANTFRITDYQGGCNGARIRFPPQSEWPSNAGSAEVLEILAPVKEQFPDMSYADLIVLAGNAGIEAAGGNAMPFCGGRVDAEDGGETDYLAPRHYSPLAVQLQDDMLVKGLTPTEYVALVGGRVYSETIASNFTAKNSLSNELFVNLTSNEATDAAPIELAFLEDPDFATIVKQFSADKKAFKEAFAAAWTKMMNADRFDGPLGNVCTAPSDADAGDAPGTGDVRSPQDSSARLSSFSFAAAAAGFGALLAAL